MAGEPGDLASCLALEFTHGPLQRIRPATHLTFGKRHEVEAAKSLRCRAGEGRTGGRESLRVADVFTQVVTHGPCIPEWTLM